MSDLARARQDHAAAIKAEQAATAHWNACWDARMTSDPGAADHQDRIDALAAAGEACQQAHRAHQEALRRLQGAQREAGPDPRAVADPRPPTAQDRE